MQDQKEYEKSKAQKNLDKAKEKIESVQELNPGSGGISNS